jgi:hypothetical protein
VKLGREIRTQQIVAVAPFGLAQFLLVDSESEGLPRHLFLCFRNPDGHESEGAAGLLLGRANP